MEYVVKGAVTRLKNGSCLNTKYTFSGDFCNMISMRFCLVETDEHGEETESAHNGFEMGVIEAEELIRSLTLSIEDFKRTKKEVV
jgi:hypothetical protein